MPSPFVTSLSDDLQESLRQQLDTRVSSNACPSVVGLVFCGDEIVFSHTVGEAVRGEGSPDLDTVYRIASVSKGFTAATVLRLRDQGMLSLDAPITDFVPVFRQGGTGPRFSPPTVRQLLSMSGGLPTDDPWADRQESITNEELRAFVAGGVYLTTAPGTVFQYSNLGYALVGQVVEAVTGRRFHDVATEEILVPLGLTSTGYEASVVPEERLARGYRRGLEDWVPVPYAGPGAFSCIGGLFSSARDLMTWVNWLAEALRDEDSPSDVLSPTSRREMQQIVTAITGGDDLWVGELAGRSVGYGFGLMAEHDAALGHFVAHSGGYPGFSSHIRWHADTGIGVVVLENGTYSGATGTGITMMQTVVKGLGYHVSPIRPLSETVAMAERVTEMLYSWSDDETDVLFEPNVALDFPYDERRYRSDAAIEEVGGLAARRSIDLSDTTSDSPLHLTWTVPGLTGALRCELRLSPIVPARIQTFRVSPVHDARTA